MNQVASASERSAGNKAGTRIPLRIQGAVYAAQTFSNSSETVVAVIVPLWASALGASPLMIGLIIGARHFVPMLLAIHGGSVMDRLGVRRVLVCVTVLGVVTPLLFPVFPATVAAVLLQIVGGLSSTFGVIGSQASIGRIMKGDPVYAGRASFVLRLGQFAGPLAAGFFWDLWGPWGGFGVLAAWGVGLFLSSLLLPGDGTARCPQAPRATEWLPKLSDYVGAFRLMAIPMVLLGVLMTVLRVGGNSIQNSFYVVYLEHIGFPGTTIGLLLGAGSAFGCVTTLLLGRLTQLIRPHRLMIFAVAAGILLVTITPVLGGVFLLLLVVSALRGGAVGLTGPLITSVLARATSADDQGKTAGLRATANRLSAFLVPVLMGGVVHLIGMERAFLALGLGLTGLSILSAVCLGSGRRAGTRSGPSRAI